MHELNGIDRGVSITNTGNNDVHSPPRVRMPQAVCDFKTLQRATTAPFSNLPRNTVTCQAFDAEIKLLPEEAVWNQIVTLITNSHSVARRQYRTQATTLAIRHAVITHTGLATFRTQSSRARRLLFGAGIRLIYSSQNNHTTGHRYRRGDHIVLQHSMPVITREVLPTIRTQCS